MTTTTVNCPPVHISGRNGARRKARCVVQTQGDCGSFSIYLAEGDPYPTFSFSARNEELARFASELLAAINATERA